MQNRICQAAKSSAARIASAYQKYQNEIKTVHDIIESLEREKYVDSVTEDISRDIVESLHKITHSFNADNNLKKPFIIACCGQVKAGKSYFLSEILRGELELPSEDLPCTRRCIRIYFNETKVFRLTKISKNSDLLYREEPQTENKEFTTIGSIREHIVLTDVEINEKENFMILVEIGVPCELLKSGIQLIDTPGLNEPLQNLSQSVNSILSYLKPNILLYIFDYRETFSLKDCTRLDSVCKSLRGNNYKLILIANKVDTDPEAAERDGNRTKSDRDYEYNVDEVINDRMKDWFPRISKQQVFPLSTLKLRDHRLDSEEEDFMVDENMKAFLEFEENVESGFCDHMHMLTHDLIESCVFDWRILFLLAEDKNVGEQKNELSKSFNDNIMEKFEKLWEIKTFLSDVEEIMTKVSNMKQHQLEGSNIEWKKYFDQQDKTELNNFSADEELKMIKKIVELNMITDFIEARCFEITAYHYTYLREKAFKCQLKFSKPMVISSLIDIKNEINKYFHDIKDNFINTKVSELMSIKDFSEMNCADYVERIKSIDPIRFWAEKILLEPDSAEEYKVRIENHPVDLKKLKDNVKNAKQKFAEIIKFNSDCQVKCKLQLSSLTDQD